MQIQTIDIKYLDCDFHGSLIYADPLERKDQEIMEGVDFINQKYPVLKLFREKRDKGCYIFYELTDTSKIIPLYIGRTCTFLTRFHQHWCRPEDWLCRYSEMIDNESWITDSPFCIDFGIWIVEDKNARKFKEHELIGKYKTYFNKA